MKVVLQQAGESVGELDLSECVHTIGRSDDCSIVVKDPSPAAAHARIFEEQGVVYVEPIDGETQVNGAAISARTALTDSDQLSFGSVDLSISIPSTPSSQPLPKLETDPPDVPDEGDAPAEKASARIGKGLLGIAKASAREAGRGAKLAGLKAQIEKVRRINLHNAHLALGRKAYELGVMSDELSSEYTQVRDIETQIAEKRQGSSADGDAGVMAKAKAKAVSAKMRAEAELLERKQNGILTKIGERAVEGEPDHTDLRSEMENVADVQHRIQELEGQHQAAVDDHSAREELRTSARGVRDSVTCDRSARDQLAELLRAVRRRLRFWPSLQYRARSFRKKSLHCTDRKAAWWQVALKCYLVAVACMVAFYFCTVSIAFTLLVAAVVLVLLIKQVMGAKRADRNDCPLSHYRAALFAGTLSVLGIALSWMPSPELVCGIAIVSFLLGFVFVLAVRGVRVMGFWSILCAFIALLLISARSEMRPVSQMPKVSLGAVPPEPTISLAAAAPPVSQRGQPYAAPTPPQAGSGPSTMAPADLSAVAPAVPSSDYSPDASPPVGKWRKAEAFAAQVLSIGFQVWQASRQQNVAPSTTPGWRVIGEPQHRPARSFNYGPSGSVHASSPTWAGGAVSGRQSTGNEGSFTPYQGGVRHTDVNGNPGASIMPNGLGFQIADSSGNPAGRIGPHAGGYQITDRNGNPSGFVRETPGGMQYIDANGNPAGSSHEFGNATFEVDANGNPSGSLWKR